MSKKRIFLLVFVALCAGIMIGGYLFSQSQPRSFISINRCDKCLTHEDLMGLIASVGIQKFPGLAPFKIYETDKTIAFKYPFSSGEVHYIIVPKKDIKNVGEISESNKEYFTDALFVARWIIEKQKLSKYQLYTNGPGNQQVTYLHLHLISK